jgi:hypothetical protein
MIFGTTFNVQSLLLKIQQLSNKGKGVKMKAKEKFQSTLNDTNVRL